MIRHHIALATRENWKLWFAWFPLFIHKEIVDENHTIFTTSFAWLSWVERQHKDDGSNRGYYIYRLKQETHS